MYRLSQKKKKKKKQKQKWLELRLIFYFIFSFLTFCRNCEWKWLQTRPKWKLNLSKSKIQKDFVDVNEMEWIICLCNNFLSALYSQTGVPLATHFTYRQVVIMIKEKLNMYCDFFSRKFWKRINSCNFARMRFFILLV